MANAASKQTSDAEIKQALVAALQSAESKLVELRSILADHGISAPCTDEIVKAQDALILARG